MSFWDDEKERVPIKSSVKKKVYSRAKGKCESCGTPLEINQGDFHHTRDPKVSATSKTVQFLCPTCHRIHGHKRVTRTESGFFEDTKVTKVVRLKAPNLKKNDTKKRTTKKTSKSSKKATNRKTPNRSRTKSGRWRKKRSDAGKKRK